MSGVNIQTSQNVSLKYNLANAGDRILGGLLDMVIVLAYFFIVSRIVESEFFYYRLWDVWKYRAILTLFMLPAIFYSFWMELLFNGQTVGKIATRIRVIRMDGSPATVLDFFLRWMLRIADVWVAMGGIGIVTMVVNERGQRLGDMLAGTTCVKLTRRQNLDDSVFMETDENYRVQFPEAERLRESHITLIRDVLASFNHDHNYEVVENLSIRLRDLLNIQIKMDHIQFLETLVKDYAHLGQSGPQPSAAPVGSRF